MPAISHRYSQAVAMPTLVCADPAPPQVDASQYLYLAEIVARKYYQGRKEEQKHIRDTELFSIACHELAKCSRRYDPIIGPFDRFAMRAMRNGIIQSIRTKKMKKRVAEFDVLPNQEWIELPEKKEEQPLFNVEDLPRFLNLLSSGDRKLIEDIYFANKSVAEIAEQLKVSRMTVYNRRDSILNKLREGFLNELDDEG